MYSPNLNALACIWAQSHRISKRQMINLWGLIITNMFKVNAKHHWYAVTSFLSVAGLYKYFRPSGHILNGLIANLVSRILICFFMSPVGATSMMSCSLEASSSGSFSISNAKNPAILSKTFMTVCELKSSHQCGVSRLQNNSIDAQCMWILCGKDTYLDTTLRKQFLQELSIALNLHTI